MPRKTTAPKSAGVLKELKAVIRPDKAEFLPGFFQAYPGGYGEGDHFLGVVAPDQRRIAKSNREMSLSEIEKLLESKWHECRMTALYILVDQFERLEKLNAQLLKKSSTKARPDLSDQFDQCEADQQRIVDFYLAHTDRVNNWDLVDSSSHKILGRWVVPRPKQRKILHRLVRSRDMWEQRIAVISTLALIREHQFDEILQFAEKLLGHPHDLMHKAVGWMLREAGKRDPAVLNVFLENHVTEMPRTMLRYSIEKLPEAERKQWLNRS